MRQHTTQESTQSRVSAPRNRRSERNRLGVVLVFMVLVFAGFVARLWSIQITHAEEYQGIAQRQSSGKAPITAPRGMVYDRAGRAVAVNIIRHSICAYPESEREATQAATYLDKIFKTRRGYHRSAHNITARRFRWIQRGVTDSLARRIQEDAPAGIYVREEQGREYPFELVGKQILGYTNIDNLGISGIERRYDSSLHGVDGLADIARDGLSQTYRIEERPLRPASPGKSLVLTVDWEFQEIVEEELRLAVAKNRALSGTAVFVDCRTGEILAAAHHDPYERNLDRPVKLRAITDVFEPGSIYKVIAAAAVLDANIMSVDTVIYCENGKWKCGHRILGDDKKHGALTFREIIELSSNIGTAKAAILLGGEKLSAMSRRFGVGQRTRVDFPGEQDGRLHADMKWGPYNVAALSIGHSVSLTPLHMTMIMAAIANDGELLRPRFVRGIAGATDILDDFRDREVVGRVMRAETASLVRDILRGVVVRGTAIGVNSPLVEIAGKTGTAEVPRIDGRGYLKNKFNASFAGFFPVDSPQVAGIVLLNQPEPIHYGGLTSGPAFRAIAERYVLAHPGRFGAKSQALAIAERDTKGERIVPLVVGLTAQAAANKAAAAGLTLRGVTKGGDITWQFPAAGPGYKNGKYLVIAADSWQSDAGDTADTEAWMVTPNLVGLTAREASLLLSRLGVTFELAGIGRVTDHWPPAGALLRRANSLRIDCASGAAATPTPRLSLVDGRTEVSH